MSVTTSSLPSSWAEVPLSAIAVVNPRGSNTELPDETVVSFLPMRAVAEETGHFDLGESRPVSEVRKGYTQFQDGDILIAKITPCMENGKAAVVSGLRHGIGYGSTEFHVVRLLASEFDRRFYFHYIVQSGFRREARRHMTGSAGQLRVPSAYLAEVPVPVPPLPEQRRIVAKIEELFTHLDAGVAALQAVKQQIKRYRQAVLRDAFTGKLTEEWRERELRKPGPVFGTGRETGVGDRGTRQPVGQTKLPPLPRGWTWCDLRSVTSFGPQNGLYLPKTRYGAGTPILRIDDYQTWWCRPHSEWRRVDVDVAALRPYLLTADDVVINRVNSPSHLGKSMVVLATMLPAVFESNMMRLRLHGSALPRYLHCFLSSDDGRRLLTANAKWAVNQASINQQDVLSTPIPLCPLPEQQAVLSAIDRHFSIADFAEKAVDESLAKAEHLRQSILKQAFEGKLVPQDPNDEPAEKLLARIRAGRTDSDGQRAGTPRRRRTADDAGAQARGTVTPDPVPPAADQGRPHRQLELF